MGNPKPVLGYATKSEAAAALSAQGMRDKDIAPLVGASINSIGRLVSYGRNSVVVRRRLHAEASKRGLTATELRRALMTKIVEDDLVAAILDDGS